MRVAWWWVLALGCGGASPDGGGKDPADTAVSGTDDPTPSPTDPGTSPAGVDSDLDGLTDAEEAALGTDPALADTDRDALSDGDEVARGTDPLAPDSDGDGLIDGDEVGRGSDPLSLDTDGDGLGDYDEVVVHGTSPIEVDTDNDGLDDPDELALGTDPTSSDSDNDLLRDGEEVALGTDPLRPDSDRDGLRDGSEGFYGTDPTDPDTDFDGVGDGDEVERGLDPLAADTDGDGLLDGEELTRGSSPTERDTDGDGIEDGAEIGLGTNPLLADSDADGLLDGEEGPIGTRPDRPDTDGDGLLDGEEVELGTDPLLADSDTDRLSDGAEVRTWGTDPLEPDTEGDGLLDGAEVELGSDPWRHDTDRDGLSDGEEVLTSPVRTDTDGGGASDGNELADRTDPNAREDDLGCPPLLVDRAPWVSGPPIDPAWVELRLVAGFQGGEPGDWAWASGPGAGEQLGLLEFTLRSEAGDTCWVELPAAALRAQDLDQPTANGARLVAAWDLDWSRARTTCGPLPEDRLGSSEAIPWLSGLPWVLGTGPLLDDAAARADAAAAGVSFDLAWAPFARGLYASLGGLAEEVGYGFAFPARCGQRQPAAPAGPWWAGLERDAVLELATSAAWSVDELLLDPLGDSCLDLPPTPLGIGRHHLTGSLARAVSDLGFGPPSCLGGFAPGGDRMIQVEIPPGGQLDAEVEGEGDLTLALLSDCTDARTCLVGANAAPAGGGEALVYRPAGPGPESLTLVVDCAGDSCGSYDLLVEIGEAAPSLLAEDCALAAAAPMLGVGAYELIEPLGGTDDLDLPAGACTGGRTPGPDGFVRVGLAAGQTVEVEARTEAGDVEVYLLDSCLPTPSCVVGAGSEPKGAAERLRFTHPGPGPAEYLLGFDCQSLVCAGLTATVQIE